MRFLVEMELFTRNRATSHEAILFLAHDVHVRDYHHDHAREHHRDRHAHDLYYRGLNVKQVLMLCWCRYRMFYGCLPNVSDPYLPFLYY